MLFANRVVSRVQDIPQINNNKLLHVLLNKREIMYNCNKKSD